MSSAYLNRPIRTEAEARTMTKHGHQHGEAFCLMWYRCDTCDHAEQVWNSRDGVTPFAMGCPSCGNASLQHVDWGSDEYAPKHELRDRQRFWRDGTIEEARASLERRLGHFAKIGQPAPDDVKSSMLADLEKPSDERLEFKDGWPMLDIHVRK